MDRASSRLRVLAVLVGFMFLALSTRLWFLQVLAPTGFAKAASAQSVRTVVSDALRGNIVDSNGAVLVENRPSLEVRVNQTQLGSKPQAAAVVGRLAKLLGISVNRIQAALADKRYLPFQPKPVAEFVPKDVAFYIGEHQSQFPGVQVVQTSVRFYPQGKLAAHELGWVGQISAAELASSKFAGYGQNDLVGKSGLEQIYEQYLRGQKGVARFLVNSQGQTLSSLSSTSPTAGDELVLTLDAKIQRIAEQELLSGLKRARSVVDSFSGRYLRANAGAVVVLDPRTGGIKAMASLPTFDPSWFVKGLTPAQERYLFTCKCAPSLDRAYQQNYTPGSTFKPIVSLAAMKEHVVNMGGTYDCPAVYRYPKDKTTSFLNWTTANLGAMSLSTAIEQSCDTVFNQIGAEFYRRWTTNAFGSNNEPFQKDLRGFGFGTPTGVDLPGEAAGIIPDAAYALANKPIFPYGWIPGGDILLAIGSGYTYATPLQMAQAYGAIANGGKLCTPHLVDRIVGHNSQVVRHVTGACRALPYTPAELGYVRAAMERVTRNGTASLAFSGFPLDRIPVAGKTGTAPRSPFQSTSWFASMVPANNPKYVIIVMVEQGGYGAATAAPIARDIISRIFGITVSGPKSGGAGD
jgi:penicillin-binding protein 2